MSTMTQHLQFGLAVLLAFATCQSLRLGAAEPPRVADEYELKAAFLFNLAKFVRWPAAKFAGEDSPLVVGVRGEEALERFARVLRDKAIDKHKIQIKSLSQLEDLPGCHVLFLSRSEKESAARWLEALKNAGALTVGETPEFLQQGGMVQFELESGQLRLEINEQRTREAGLNIMANALSTLVNKGIARIKKF